MKTSNLIILATAGVMTAVTAAVCAVKVAQYKRKNKHVDDEPVTEARDNVVEEVVEKTEDTVVEKETTDTEEAHVDTHEARMKQIDEEHEARMKQIDEIGEKLQETLDNMTTDIKAGNFENAEKQLKTVGTLMHELTDRSAHDNNDKKNDEFKPDRIMIMALKQAPELVEKYPEYKEFI